MRVLLWSELFWPYIGGGEVWGARLILTLRDLGHEFIVVTSHSDLELPDSDDYSGVPIYRFPFRTALPKADLSALVRARRQADEVISEFAPDLVQLNGIGASSSLYLQTRRAHPTPLLVTMNTEILPGEGAGPQTLVGRVLRGADWVSCVSADVLRQVREWVPETTDHSSVIYMGIEAPTLTSAPPPNPAPTLLFVGRLVPDKGVDVALEAIALIVDRYPDLRLVVAGDGVERRQLEQQAAQLGLEEVVEFAGWVDPSEVPDLIASATAVVMPSRREGLPVVASQAALVGRPIVGTPVAGIPEIVIHGETGLLVETEDAAALAEALSHVLNDPETSARMGQAARRRGLEMFSLSSCVSAYDALYRKLAAKK